MDKKTITHTELLNKIRLLIVNLAPGDIRALRLKFKEAFPEGVVVEIGNKTFEVKDDHPVIPYIWKNELSSQIELNAIIGEQYSIAKSDAVTKKPRLTYNGYEAMVEQLQANFSKDDTEGFLKMLRERYPNGVDVIIDGEKITIPVDHAIHVDMFKSSKERQERLAKFRLTCKMFQTNN